MGATNQSPKKTPSSPQRYAQVPREADKSADDHFDESTSDAFIFFMHAKTAATISALVGIFVSLAALIVVGFSLYGVAFENLSFYFEKIPSIYVLSYLALIAAVVLIVQLLVIVGVKRGSGNRQFTEEFAYVYSLNTKTRPHLLMPYIVLHSLLLLFQIVPVVVIAADFSNLQFEAGVEQVRLIYRGVFLFAVPDETAFYLIAVLFLVVLNIQAFMIYVIVRCHFFLQQKQLFYRKKSLLGKELVLDENAKQFLVCGCCSWHSRRISLFFSLLAVFILIAITAGLVTFFLAREHRRRNADITETSLLATITCQITLIFYVLFPHFLANILLLLGVALGSCSYVEGAIVTHILNIIFHTAVFVGIAGHYVRLETYTDTSFLIMTVLFVILFSMQLVVVRAAFRFRKYLVRKIKYSIATRLLTH